VLTTGVSVSSRESLRSAGRGDLLILATKLELGNQAFSVSGPTAFDYLPTKLEAWTNTTVFKRDLETFLFSEAYDVA
jgi:hypothetical protein